jgi:CubicO group peptidase (beta-lactamase class C family)
MVEIMKAAFVTFLVASLISPQLSAQQNDKIAATKIDPLFNNFNVPTPLPGCAVGVEQSGKILFSKGYGMADLEHNVPLTPQSMFYMASVSKQFTALTILLLAEDGKLQLTDSVRKFIPELPAYANGITIYQLLTHTSGIRDYLSLGDLAGLSPEFVYTDDNSLKLIARQKAPNFQPGSEFLYSNSGYFLLSLVVKKVTGELLNNVAHNKIFDPLGMKSTRFQHDHTALIPNKAIGYELREHGWHTSNSMLDVVGDGGLYSSVDDMMLWMKNIDSPTVGAKALVVMETPGKLKNGTPINYGMGLQSSDYRGLKVVEHGGGLAGYRTEDLWFPQQQFSVVVLCNNGFAYPPQLARQVAEVYLSPQMQPPPAAVKSDAFTVALAHEDIEAKAGMYRAKNGSYANIAVRDGMLFGVGSQAELVPLDKYQFLYKDAPNGLRAVFDHGIPARNVDLSSEGQPPVRYVRADPVALKEKGKKAYLGDYESGELGVRYHIALDAQGLFLTPGDQPARMLRSTGVDRMLIGGPGEEVSFSRDRAGNVTGFALNAGRVRNLRFSKVALKRTD